MGSSSRWVAEWEPSDRLRGSPLLSRSGARVLSNGTAARADDGLPALPAPRPVPRGPRGEREDLPLSVAQERLWFLDQYDPG